MDMPMDYVVPVQGDKARYKMHKYWAGKPWYVVAQYIRHFTREGDIVLDPFCGKGVVGCEALIHRRKAVLRDLNPMATFISDSLCISPVDLTAFRGAFEDIAARVKDEIMDMYRLQSSCPQCGGSVYAKHFVRGPALEGNWIVEARCEHRHGRSGHFRRKLTPGEIARIHSLESRHIPYWFPDDEIPRGRETMRLIGAGILRVDQLFTRRNLLALSKIYHEICRVRDPKIRQLLTLAFSNTLLHTSKLKSEKLRPMSANSYYCMGDWIEENVWKRFENRVMWRWGVYEGKKETNELIGDYYRRARDFSEIVRGKTFLIATGPAQSLTDIPDKSIDYIFTDPPYGGIIQYYELTMLWRAWLGMGNGFIMDEITVNDHQQKGHQNFEDMLTQAFSEAHRVLKPGKWLTVTFNHRDSLVWVALLQACRRAGFELVNVVGQNPLGNSFVQSWAGKVLKRDLILNFRKPGGKARQPDQTPNFAEGPAPAVDPKDIVLTSAREYLSHRREATLPELFEAAIIYWLSVAYGQWGGRDPQKFEVSRPDEAFDMDFVDGCLVREAGYVRRESKGRILYEKL